MYRLSPSALPFGNPGSPKKKKKKKKKKQKKKKKKQKKKKKNNNNNYNNTTNRQSEKTNALPLNTIVLQPAPVTDSCA
nr:hypothetical protein BaRGS_028261 [Batillaria attramentaria]